VRWGGYVAALIAAAFVGASLYEPKEFPMLLGIFGAVVFGTPAYFGIRLGHWPEIYAIEISALGVRQVSSGAFVPWSGIVRLRERGLLERVDLIGHAGPTGISLEYQLERFQEALARVVEHVRSGGLPAPTSFGRPWSSGWSILHIAALVGFIGLGVWLWYSEDRWKGLLIIVAMSFFFVVDRWGEISRVTLAHGVLAVRRGIRVAEYPLHDIASVRLALRPLGKGRHSLDVYVESGGELIPIRPIGADPFELHRALTAEIERTARR
jgi:hypothetical protein